MIEIFFSDFFLWGPYEFNFRPLADGRKKFGFCFFQKLSNHFKFSQIHLIDTFFNSEQLRPFFLKMVEKINQIFSFGGPYEFIFHPLVPKEEKNLDFIFFSKTYEFISNLLKFI